jgi:hypothetical protein
MTEAIEAAASIPAATAVPAAVVEAQPLDFMDFDALDAGDIEDMEDYCGAPVLPILAKMQELQVEGEAGDAIMAHMSARLFTALLGVAKRHQDPSFTPERWRTIKLAAVTGGAPPPSNGQVPTGPAAVAGDQAKANGKPTSRRTRTPATPKSV